ncbi:MAG TPA: methyltransferase domain-containing protein, partial [Firmicutes bacterium]|nr:methyltransferase domain-containing protein [Bacillota bacterium]
MKRQIKRIRDAYNLTLDQFHKGIDPFDLLPVEFRSSPEFKKLIEDNTGHCSSGAQDIRDFLGPEKGMKYLDLGCAANLAVYRLDEWGALYYGVDISDKLIDEMKMFVLKNGIEVGGIFNCEINKLPFTNDFFDIGTVIGVFEYC